MSFSQDQNFESYLPVYAVIPENWEQGREFLVEQLKRISNVVNAREIGWFLDEEVLTGKQFFPTTNTPQGQYRSIFRKVIDFGALPNVTTKNVAHGVTVDSNFSLIDMWIAATDPVNLVGFSLKYWSQDATEDIVLNYDATNVNVTTLSNYSAYSRSYVIMEYIQEI
jgi:hypothetical protein